jgi:hypothetical protein
VIYQLQIRACPSTPAQNKKKAPTREPKKIKNYQSHDSPTCARRHLNKLLFTYHQPEVTYKREVIMVKKRANKYVLIGSFSVVLSYHSLSFAPYLSVYLWKEKARYVIRFFFLLRWQAQFFFHALSLYLFQI